MSFAGAHTFFELDQGLVSALKGFSKKRHATLFMTLFAGFSTLVSRWSGQDDFLIGTPTSGRNHTETEDLIGLFMNTLILRADAAGDPTFEQFLERIRSMTLQAFSHSDIPYIKLLEELQPERRPDRTPMTQISFALHAMDLAGFDFPDVQFSPFNLNVGSVRQDMEMHLFESHGQVRGVVHYASELYEPETIARFVRCYETVLAALLETPEERVSRLRMLSPQDEQEVRALVRMRKSDYPKDASIPEVFARWVERAPDALALDYPEAQYTYAQLDAAANKLAAKLLEAKGDGPFYVGLLLDRSANMGVAALAVLKAGGAYAPLDPEYPQERLRNMLEDLNSPVVVLSADVRETWDALDVGAVTIDIDACLKDTSSARDFVIQPSSPRVPAMVLFTSGTTGRPKGVVLPHQGPLRLLANTAYPGLAPGEAYAQGATPSFDPYTMELWGALLNGGVCVGLDKPTLLSPERLKTFIRKKDIAHMVLTTSVFNQTVFMAPDAFEPLKTLMVGGETMDPAAAKRLMENKPPQRFFNGYGPTENNTISTAYQVTAVENENIALPLGRPLENAVAYILDADKKLAPIGVPGEIFVGGDGGAVGYLNRPDLNKERFSPDPFIGEDGLNMYATGDIGRMRRDGVLEFFGRRDHQVKIRGHRIEMGDVEAALRAAPEVHRAVAVPRDLGRADARIDAYVVLNIAEKFDVESIRAGVASLLPSYMVPATITPIDEIPLTLNGKLDVRALPMAEAQLTSGAKTVFSTETEKRLAEIWSELLHKSDIAPQDNFFTLGGNSLLAVQMVSRIKKQLGAHLEVRAVFDDAGLSSLARRIDELGTFGSGAMSIPLRKRGEPLRLSFAQERLWFLHLMEPENPCYNMPFIFRLSGELNVGALRETFALLAERQEALRTTFRSNDGAPLQVIHERMQTPWVEIDLSALPDAEREQRMQELCKESFLRPFALERDMPIRVDLIRMGRQEWVLLVCMHHIASDGWSVGVLGAELSALYAHNLGQGDLPPTPAVQYADYALWQREYLSGEYYRKQMRYWRGALLDAPAELALPTDYPRPKTPSYRGGMHVFMLDQELTSAINALAEQEGATLFMTLHAAFTVLMSRLSGQSDIVVGTPYAGRNSGEIESLIGFFVNTLALRSELAPETPFNEFLQQSKNTVLGAFEHSDIPFEKVVAAAAPERTVERMPLVQTMFALQEVPIDKYQFAGLELAPVKLDSPIVRMDLETHVWEYEGRLTGVMWYALDLFAEKSIQRFSDCFEALLRSIVQAPDQPISRLDILTEQERALIATLSAPKRTDYPRQNNVPTLFAAQTGNTPDAVALDFPDGKLTYAELETRANQLANRLAALRAGAAPFAVGVCMRRSARLAVALTAILKAGGVYVPLDPEYPVERLRFMMQDAEVAVVLVDDFTEETLSPHTGIPPLQNVDDHTISDEFSTPPESGLAVPATAPAYIIYTSGTTGAPKGVVVPHRAIVRLVKNTDYVDINQGEIMAQASNSSFDAYTFEIWGALLNGATLLGVDKETLLTPTALKELLSSQGVDYMFLTTALFNQCAKSAPEMFNGLRMLSFGGEAVDPGAVRRVLDAGGPERLLHVYGPTENTTFSTWFAVQDVPEGANSVPIGRPLANSTAYILDEGMQPVPVGAPGELYVGGDGLALEYLNRPQRTFQSFKPDPFSPAPGAKMYATGDVVRMLADGNIEFIGRRDAQVKVRGHRIELEEIQQELEAHPAVGQAVAVVSKDTEHDVLAAYVTPSGFADADDKEALARQFIEEWRELYAETYCEFDESAATPAPDSADPTLCLAGWNSSYTGQPIAQEEMLEWLDATIQRIQEFQAKRILEIGCGTGLLLSRLAPLCDAYMGVDYSPQAVRAIERLKERYPELAHVQVEQRFADDFSTLEEGAFDLVILNSIVQYFPDMDYLVRVLEGAVKMLAPGGAVFIGDVRNLETLPMFHADVIVHRSEKDVLREQIQAQVQRAQLHDKELVISPQFFAAFAQQAPSVRSSRIDLKKGRFANELNCYRYDAALLLKEEGEHIHPEWLEWGDDVESLEELEQKLQNIEDPLGVRGIVDLRLSEGLWVSTWLESPDTARTTVQDLRNSERPKFDGVYPEQLFTVAEKLGMQVETRLGDAPNAHGKGELSIVFFPKGTRRTPVSYEDIPPRPWKEYGNEPLIGKLAQGLPAALHAHLKQRLPEYMRPTSLMVLENMPLTPNGKLDRRALPAPRTAAPGAGVGDVKFRDALEMQIARIWRDGLNVEGIGPDDNYFDLGGHSLLAIGLIREVEKELGVKLSVKDLMLHPTVAGLARRVKEVLMSVADEGETTQDVGRIIPLRAAGDRPPLFCAHPFNGANFCYVPLANILGEERPVYGLQAPGLQRGEEALQSVEAMAEYYLRMIRKVQPQGPVHLLGWSFGGLIAYELARKLQQNGTEDGFGAQAVLLLDSAGPDLLRSQAEEARWGAHVVLKELIDDSAPGLWGTLPAEMLESPEAIVEHGRKSGHFPKDFTPDDLQRLHQLYVTQGRSMVEYQPAPLENTNSSGLKLVVIRAADNEYTSELPPELGWETLSENITLLETPGEHSSMLKAPNVEILAEKIAAVLDEIEGVEE